jgi:hypothetical protein
MSVAIVHPFLGENLGTAAVVSVPTDGARHFDESQTLTVVKVMGAVILSTSDGSASSGPAHASFDAIG